MSTRRFELSDGSSDKFWEITVDGASVTTRWGRIGTKGQTKSKEHASADRAAADAAKQIDKKVAKGYAEAGAAAPAETAERPAPAFPDEPRDLADGETAEVPGSGGRSYTLTNVGGAYSCTCPAWRHQSAHIDRRTCKHIRRYRGEAAETERLGSLPARAVRGSGANPDAPKLLLANSWDERDPSGWWMSEKLDGVRAYWDGERFFSRLGNEYLAPDWFVESLGSEPLDGELFGGRGEFQRTVSIVRRADRGAAWEGLRFLVFDAPARKSVFEARLEFLHARADGWAHAEVLAHTECAGHDHLREELARVEGLGGEGLMLRRPGSRYVHGRSDSLLKVKSFHDAEARVIAHLPGTGKHKGRLGALQVELPDGTVFKVGTGFTNQQREDPPAIGSVICFRYQELTKAGVPRFPTFVGERHDVEL